ncbi:ABC transporter ATP-binding protein [Proteinivorax tanatarense]|uniref:ABC transporter ATP-binding protein n=1 Tax=Proteinivorax tanatarense TaxID=1260629 RepID=A0AAU7VJM6_9FIRM
MHIYSINDVCKSFNNGKVEANKNITFSIKRGEIIGFLGPNGAGKSTLVKQMVGLLKPDEGDIHFYDQKINSNPEVLTYFLGYMPQRIGALGDLTASEAIRVTCKLKGLTNEATKVEVKTLMDEFDLNRIDKRPLNKLSGGENRLVAFCIALIANPEILILDEPTDGLDPEVRKIVWNKIMTLNREKNTTIVLVTHNVVEAERVLQRVGLINNGSIRAIGTVGELKDKISNQIKLDLKFNAMEKTNLINLFKDSSIYKVVPLDESHFIIYCDKEYIQSAIKILIENIGLEKFNDFNISTPNLEDVYIQLKKEGIR